MPTTHTQSKVIDVSKGYSIKKISGLINIISFVANAGDPIPVTVDRLADIREEYGDRMFGSYGTRLDYVEDAFQFTNGRILTCCTVSEWGGTFQTHDDIKIQYYALTPE